MTPLSTLRNPVWVIALVAFGALLSGCASMTFRSGDDWLDVWPRKAEGVFEGIEVSLALPGPHSGVSLKTDQFHDPPLRSFRLGPAHFVFLSLTDDQVEVLVNTVSVGILQPGDTVHLEADGTILVNEGEAIFASPDDWPEAFSDLN